MTVKIDTSPGAATRIDKWLWAARFFKTRSLATQAVDKGRVLHNGQRCKPARDVRPGDRLQIDNGSTQWQVTVRAIADVRGAALVAQALYEESEESRLRRAEEGERRRLYREPAAVIQGRPTKRDRRRMVRLVEHDE
ncbi:MAG: RNA-binding S4 domain-containing protein [Burkholderiales bacterium]|nr:RNA-binding S4 domain-containing protein [Burkholderiales bacterium]MDE2286757.1 RNA-binding S4 domain-containing protein [Burkholderiales bacterium]MDE2609702.1 RNA-binding S4 domain-containing protein [Burkholderiales bacterium]